MPTGYTAAIKDGISFEQYALDCARAFGACVMLRDEGGGGEKIPESFEPSNYHAEKLVELAGQLDAINRMTAEELKQAADADYEKQESSRLKAIAENKELRRKYEAMLESVSAWTPPKGDFTKFNEFMCEQIESSIKFDCSTEYYEKPTERLSKYEWRLNKLKTINDSIEYHTRSHSEEIERTNKRNEWVKALRDSLKS